MKSKLIAPSILSADFSALKEEIKSVEEAGADLIHVDVMDGHFVPNLTIGPVVISSIRKHTKLPFDVHLMIENPEKYVFDFLKSGANFLTVHFEACSKDTLNQIIKTVHDFGAKIGIAIKPKTNVEEISNWLSIIDLVLVMSVEPGFAGQSFIPSALEKIKNLDLLRQKNSYSYLIEVDGGINEKTIHECSIHGCNIFVAGSAIFNSNDYKNTIQNLKSKL